MCTVDGVLVLKLLIWERMFITHVLVLETAVPSAAMRMVVVVFIANNLQSDSNNYPTQNSSINQEPPISSTSV